MLELHKLLINALLTEISSGFNIPKNSQTKKVVKYALKDLKEINEKYDLRAATTLNFFVDNTRYNLSSLVELIKKKMLEYSKDKFCHTDIIRRAYSILHFNPKPPFVISNRFTNPIEWLLYVGPIQSMYLENADMLSKKFEGSKIVKPGNSKKQFSGAINVSMICDFLIRTNLKLLTSYFKEISKLKLKEVIFPICIDQISKSYDTESLIRSAFLLFYFESVGQEMIEPLVLSYHSRGEIDKLISVCNTIVMNSGSFNSLFNKLASRETVDLFVFERLHAQNEIFKAYPNTSRRAYGTNIFNKINDDILIHFDISEREKLKFLRMINEAKSKDIKTIDEKVYEKKVKNFEISITKSSISKVLEVDEYYNPKYYNLNKENKNSKCEEKLYFPAVIFQSIFTLRDSINSKKTPHQNEDSYLSQGLKVSAILGKFNNFRALVIKYVPDLMFHMYKKFRDIGPETKVLAVSKIISDYNICGYEFGYHLFHEIIPNIGCFPDFKTVSSGKIDIRGLFQPFSEYPLLYYIIQINKICADDNSKSLINKVFPTQEAGKNQKYKWADDSSKKELDLVPAGLRQLENAILTFTSNGVVLDNNYRDDIMNKEDAALFWWFISRYVRVLLATLLLKSTKEMNPVILKTITSNQPDFFFLNFKKKIIQVLDDSGRASMGIKINDLEPETVFYIDYFYYTGSEHLYGIIPTTFSKTEKRNYLPGLNGYFIEMFW
ncbi:hypothetical protein BB558_002133 [Smittium angustum]|uniref:Uncharacterized protein n=1 Tax=Smittium angustum TaxID=133377 RepID=A0A2U1J9N0_SMIAN|nr:hypothetical protein BB558_002133 [Smittium angustum]